MWQDFIFFIYLCRRYTCITMGNIKLKPDFIFESSWEVCNKVGGIYTVLSTRAKTLQDAMKDHVIFIGPDCWKENNDDYISDLHDPGLRFPGLHALCDFTDRR